MTATARGPARRAGPRLADGHAWRREGARGGCALYPDATLFTLVHVPGSVSPGHRAAVAARLAAVRPASAPAASTATCCRSSRSPSSSSTSTSSIWSSAPATARPSRWCGRAGRGTSATATRRCGTSGTSGTRTSDRRDSGRPARRRCWPVLAWLARWDAATAHRVDRYLANSQHVARRIRRYYNRQSAVIYPPVDTDFYRPDATVPTATALVVSALVPYKRIDVAIEACRLAGVPLRIVGSGPRGGEAARDGRAGRGVPRTLQRRARSAPATARPASSCSRARRTSASSRSRPRPAAGRWSRSAAAARSRRSSTA